MHLEHAYVCVALVSDLYMPLNCVTTEYTN